MRTRNFIIFAIVFALIMCGTVFAQDVTKLRVVYQIPAMEKVIIKQDLVYKTRDGKDLSFDLNYPPDFKGEVPLPVVIMVLGFADNVFQGPLKNLAIYKDWAKLFAASGMAAINYSTYTPATDIHDLILHIRKNAESLNLDADTIGLWSCSANVLNALTFLMDERKEYLKCAALYYGIMLTPDQKYMDTILQFNKMVNLSIDGVDKIQSFHQDLPLMIVRAGKDREDINQTIDYFVSQAVSNNVPLTLINYTEGRHAFDGLDDNDRSREIIRQTLNFMRSNLLKKDK